MTYIYIYNYIYILYIIIYIFLCVGYAVKLHTHTYIYIYMYIYIYYLFRLFPKKWICNGIYANFLIPAQLTPWLWVWAPSRDRDIIWKVWSPWV